MRKTLRISALASREIEKEARMGEDDAFSSGNAELKISWTSCQDILEKAGCTDF